MNEPYEVQQPQQGNSEPYTFKKSSAPEFEEVPPGIYHATLEKIDQVPSNYPGVSLKWYFILDDYPGQNISGLTTGIFSTGGSKGPSKAYRWAQLLGFDVESLEEGAEFTTDSLVGAQCWIQTDQRNGKSKTGEARVYSNVKDLVSAPRVGGQVIQYQQASVPGQVVQGYAPSPAPVARAPQVQPVRQPAVAPRPLVQPQVVRQAPAVAPPRIQQAPVQQPLAQPQRVVTPRPLPVQQRVAPIAAEPLAEGEPGVVGDENVPF